MTRLDWLPDGRDQLLVVKDPGDLASLARGRYPQFDVTVSPSYLAGIAALSRREARGLLVGVDPTARKLDSAVAGLRKAAGPSSRLVLCCPPSGEPLARRVLSAGADDYLIYPPRGDELDAALGLPADGAVFAPPAPGEAAPSWEEITALAGILAGLGAGRRAMLQRMCEMIAGSLRTCFVRITADRDTACVGDLHIEPALAEPISAGGKTFGQVLIGPRQRAPFSSDEAQKLRHYARLIGHLLAAAEDQERWQRLAMIDEVSQLPNRRYLMQVLESLLVRATKDRSRITLVLFDMDGFKHFNDTYGHSAGDQILQETGQLIRQHCRQHDIVARYSGDEFAVVFWDAEEPRITGSQHPRSPLAVMARFRKALESHAFPKLGPEARGCITVSGGLATFPWDGKDALGLIDKADQAMLHAKRDGKNRIYLVGSQGRPAHEASAAGPFDDQ